MSDLRDIVTRHVEDQLRSEFPVGEFSDGQLSKILDNKRADGSINREVNRILDTFLEEIEENSSKKKRRRILNFSFSAAGLILTTIIGYAVNMTNWSMVIGMIIAMLIVNALFLFFADQ